MMASFFSYFGGGAAAKRNNASKEAIVKLRQQLEMLRKREIHTEKQMLEQDAIARKNVTTNKTGTSAVPNTRADVRDVLTATNHDYA
jgi:charged multivesicular body protein 4